MKEMNAVDKNAGDAFDHDKEAEFLREQEELRLQEAARLKGWVDELTAMSHCDLLEAAKGLLENLMQANKRLEDEIVRGNAIDILFSFAKKKEAKVRFEAKSAAHARHAKPGGADEKRKAIRLIWGAGKYTSRSRCAEEECGGLGMSYEAARRALRNTPDV